MVPDRGAARGQPAFRPHADAGRQFAPTHNRDGPHRRGARAPAAGPCRPHAIGYGRTASSIVQGHAFDAHLREEIRDIAGCPGTSATHSIFTACQTLGVKRAVAISPYTAEVDAAEHRFFAEGGIETVAGAHLGITDGFRL